MEYETAGDPITGLKWTRRTTEKIAHELAKIGGIEVSANTVGRILKELGYSLRVNHKKISSGTGPDRDAQFQQISAARDRFSGRGLPVISVDPATYAAVAVLKRREGVDYYDHDTNSRPFAIGDR